MKRRSHSNPPSPFSNSLDQALQSMKSAGLKHTPHRTALLKFLIQHHGPFSKEEIQRALSKLNLDGVTLYRNLAHFELAGLVRRSEFGDGVSRYEFQSSPDHHHHHIVCTVCRNVENLEGCVAPPAIQEVQKRGYISIRHSLEFFGICPKCSRAGEGR